jgi:hypothetical protein
MFRLAWIVWRNRQLKAHMTSGTWLSKLEPKWIEVISNPFFFRIRSRVFFVLKFRERENNKGDLVLFFVLPRFIRGIEPSEAGNVIIG